MAATTGPAQMTTAHQKIIRDQRADADSDIDLFGKWWMRHDLTLGKTTVRQVSVATAKTIIDKYEWLGTMPAIILHCYGIYFDGGLGGAVVFSPEYAENLGVWDRYGYTGKIICLSRGACAHWTPTGTATRLIGKAIKYLPKKYEVVTATVDSEAGEIGTIYQAANFIFVGQMSEGGRRVSFAKDGKLVSARQAQRDYGTRGLGISEMGAEGVKQTDRKKRYFYFCGNKTVRKKNRAAIEHLIKPYPKRDNQK